MTTGRFDVNAAASALAADGWCVQAGLMSPAQTQALASECAAMHDARLLLPARTGAARSASPLRGDRTRWFATGAMTVPQQEFTDNINALRTALNRELMLSLVECEAHYAVYRPGAAYARHLDRLRDNDARVISAVFYLNSGWREEDGGALRLYLDDGSARDIEPLAGTLVLFMSARFEHEVLPARRDRMSIACWLRQRPAAPH